MGQASSKFRNVQGGGLLYWCPGCELAHEVRVGDGPHPRWSWNGDLEKPVFSPSVLVIYDELTEAGNKAYEAWKAAGSPEPVPAFERIVVDRCHTFVGCNGAQPGQVIFLTDCTHKLAGQVVDFPDLPDWLKDDAP